MSISDTYQAGADTFAVGSMFGDVVKAFKASLNPITATKASIKATLHPRSTFRQLQRNPASVAASFGLAPAVKLAEFGYKNPKLVAMLPPPYGPAAAAAIGVGHAVLDRAHAGDPQAVGAIAQVSTQARAGNPRSAAVLLALRGIEQLRGNPAAFAPGDEASPAIAATVRVGPQVLARARAGDQDALDALSRIADAAQRGSRAGAAALLELRNIWGGMRAGASVSASVDVEARAAGLYDRGLCVA